LKVLVVWVVELSAARSRLSRATVKLGTLAAVSWACWAAERYGLASAGRWR
jgi:hypothetical protein